MTFPKFALETSEAECTVQRRRLAPLDADWPPFLVLFFCQTTFFELRNIPTSDHITQI